MSDSLLFIAGLTSILYTAISDIIRFKNGKYNPKLLRGRENNVVNFREFISYFISIIPMWLVQSTSLRGIYILVVLASLIAVKTALNLLMYKSKKEKNYIDQIIMFDALMIILGIIVLFRFVF